MDFRRNQLLNVYLERKVYHSHIKGKIVFSLSNYKFLLDRFATSACFHVSILTLLFSAYDRYNSIAHPLLYKSTNNVKKAVYQSIFVWVVVVIVSLHNLLLINNKFVTATVIFFLFEFIPFILMWIITLLCVFSLKKSNNSSKKLSRSKLKNKNSEFTLSILFFSMVLALTFSLSFYIYIHVCSFLPNFKHNLNFLLVADAVLSTNSFWNFILYNVLNKKYRQYVNVFLFKKFF